MKSLSGLFTSDSHRKWEYLWSFSANCTWRNAYSMSVVRANQWVWNLSNSVHVNQKWRTNHKAVVQPGMLWGEVAAAVIHYPCWFFLDSMMWNEMAVMGYVWGDVCLILPKSHFNACFECPVTVLSKLNFKKTCMQKVWFLKKNLFTSQIQPMTSWLQVSFSTLWAICTQVFDGILLKFAQVFSTTLSPTQCRMEADHRINLWWQIWSERTMGLRRYAIDLLMPAVPGELSTWRTDRLFFSYIYLLSCRALPHGSKLIISILLSSIAICPLLSDKYV